MENRNFYTKGQRLTIYKAALEYIKATTPDEQFRTPYCFVMDIVVSKYANTEVPKLFFNAHAVPQNSAFPELSYFRPKKTVSSIGQPGGLFWFPVNKQGKEIRIAILEEIIEKLSNTI